MTELTHLHLHDKYSILDGLGDIPKFVSRAKELGMTALAETNHGNVYGSLKFHKACIEIGIKPILGQEFYVAPSSMLDKETRLMYHLTLLVCNEVGWKNLIILTSRAFLDGFYYKPRIDKELLKQHTDGLICLSGCMYGVIGGPYLRGEEVAARKEFMWYSDLFGSNFYLELMPHKLEQQKRLNHFLSQLGGQCVVTNDVHYVNKEDEFYHNFLLKVQTGGKDKFEFEVKDLYLKVWDEVREEMIGYHEMAPEFVDQLLTNVNEVVSKIDVFQFDTRHKIPVFEGSV